MFNRRFLDLGQAEIDAQIDAMPRRYTSDEFLRAFEENNSNLYEEFVRFYSERGHPRAHAIQIVNSQLMHTVNACFSLRTRKIRTVPNPKGGDMSEWRRV